MKHLEKEDLISSLKSITSELEDGGSVQEALVSIAGLFFKDLSCSGGGSSSFLQSIMDIIPVPVYYKDVFGVFILCNKALAELYGLEKSEIIGKTVFDIFDEDEAEVFSISDVVLVKENSHEMVEHKGRFSRLGDRYHSIHKRVVIDDEGNVKGIFGVINDLTDIKNQENRAWEGENYYRSVYESSPVPALLFNSLYMIEDMNSACLRLFDHEGDYAGSELSVIFEKYSDFEKIISSENSPVEVTLTNGKRLNAIMNTMYIGNSARYSIIFITQGMFYE